MECACNAKRFEDGELNGRLEQAKRVFYERRLIKFHFCSFNVLLFFFALHISEKFTMRTCQMITPLPLTRQP